MADILAEPELSDLVQFRLLHAFLDVVRRGKVNCTVNYVPETVNLRVPPSYDDYDEALRRTYAYAYQAMLNARKHSDLRLSRLTEKLYLYGLPDFYQANIMGYALAYAGNLTDRDDLDDVVEENGWDAELTNRYIDRCKQAIKNGN